MPPCLALASNSSPLMPGSLTSSIKQVMVAGQGSFEAAGAVALPVDLVAGFYQALANKATDARVVLHQQ